jgi:hypothetical protein
MSEERLNQYVFAVCEAWHNHKIVCSKKGVSMRQKHYIASLTFFTTGLVISCKGSESGSSCLSSTEQADLGAKRAAIYSRLATLNAGQDLEALPKEDLVRRINDIKSLTLELERVDPYASSSSGFLV